MFRLRAAAPRFAKCVAYPIVSGSVGRCASLLGTNPYCSRQHTIRAYGKYEEDFIPAGDKVHPHRAVRKRAALHASCSLCLVPCAVRMCCASDAAARTSRNLMTEALPTLPDQWARAQHARIVLIADGVALPRSSSMRELTLLRGVCGSWALAKVTSWDCGCRQRRNGWS